MKEQVAISLAGLMLFTAGCENAKGKMPFSAFAAGMQGSKSQKPTTQDVGEQNVHHQWQGKSGPSLYDGGLFVRADFLYWRADEDGLEYGIAATINPAARKINAKIDSPEVEWDPAFRVGIGYTFASQDYWDLAALWTHFQTTQTSSKTVSADDLSSIVPWWGATFLGSTITHASARWNLKYNVYDLDLGRNYFVSKTISAHPFLGIRGATIHQKYLAKYNAFLPTSFGATTDFWGVGAHLGSGLQWRITSGFSVVGNVGGSLLYADFKVRETYKTLLTFDGTPPTQTTPINLHQHIKTGSVNLEALLGFQWEKFFYQNRYRLSIVAGYEWSEWFVQNRLTKLALVPLSSGSGDSTADGIVKERGNLTLQGASLQVRWDF